MTARKNFSQTREKNQLKLRGEAAFGRNLAPDRSDNARWTAGRDNAYEAGTYSAMANITSLSNSMKRLLLATVN
jgi:hypothetical protein